MSGDGDPINHLLDVNSLPAEHVANHMSDPGQIRTHQGRCLDDGEGNL